MNGTVPNGGFRCLGFLGPGIPDLVAEPQNTAWVLRTVIEKKKIGVTRFPQSTCRAEWSPGPKAPNP